MAAKAKQGNYKAVLNKTAKDMKTRMANAKASLTLEAVGLLVDLTPVDTGAARFHWFVRGLPDEQFDKKRVDPIGELAKNRAKRDIKTLAKIAETIYIVNSAPYFKYLEDGSSSQAPNGVVAMVRSAIEARWPKHVETAFSQDPRVAPSGNFYAQGSGKK